MPTGGPYGPTSGCSSATFTPYRSRLLLLLELERRAVHAIALAGRLGAIREDMAEMAAALGAMDLGSGHEVAGVGRGLDGVGDRRPEGRPARAAFVLGTRVEQGLAAAGTAEGASALLV